MSATDHNVLFAMTLDQVDRVNTLLSQSQGVLGLLRHVNPEAIPDDYLVNSAWLVQSVLKQVQETLDGAVRVPAQVEAQ